MRFTNLIKKSLCIGLSVLILLVICGCKETYDEAKGTFTENENGDIVSDSGVEYKHLANEGILYYLGELEFQGGVKGEVKKSRHLSSSYQTGLFSIKNAETDNILIRRRPDNEWCSIYRKASLPTFDFSVDKCSRLELVSGNGDIREDAVHTTCGDGITDKTEIAEFLSDIRSQKSPREAGLYDMIKKPDGMLENCYISSVVYGFFEDEPNLVLRMSITSYNDLAYSISVGGKEYVLPEQWLLKLKNN